jgi:hypothetical protein
VRLPLLLLCSHTTSSQTSTITSHTTITSQPSFCRWRLVLQPPITYVPITKFIEEQEKAQVPEVQTTAPLQKQSAELQLPNQSSKAKALQLQIRDGISYRPDGYPCDADTIRRYLCYCLMAVAAAIYQHITCGAIGLP